MVKKRVKRMISILLAVVLAVGLLPFTYGNVSCAATDISVSDLPPYPSNGQKYWVVFTEGFRNERLEMATCDISGYGKYAYIVWNTSLLLRGANATGRYNQYCLNEKGDWEQIGSYQRFTDYAVSVVASNLDIYDAYGNKMISKTENYGMQNNSVVDNFGDIATTYPQITSTPRTTLGPYEITEPETTSKPYEAEEPEIMPEPYGAAEEPETTLEPHEITEPETTLKPYEAEEPEITLEPYEEPETTLEPYEAEEPETTPEPYEIAEPEMTSDVTDTSKNEEVPKLSVVSTDSKEEESENIFEEETKYSDESKKLPRQGQIVTVGAVKYIVKKSAKSKGAVSFYSVIQKNASMVEIPEKVKINGYTFKVTGIYKNAFKNMKKLSDVKLGKNIKTIGSSAFQNCKKLRTIVIPRNVMTIGVDAFAGSGLNYLLVKSKKINMLGLGAFRNTGKKMVVLTPSAKRNQYMGMLVNQGKMSRKAIFLKN